MQVILQAYERPKQGHKDVLLSAHPQERYLLVRELGLIMNHENIPSDDSSVEETDQSFSSW